MPTSFRHLMGTPSRTGRVFLGLAALVSLYLATSALTQTAVPGCEVDSGCQRVLASRGASLFGLPGSFWGLMLFCAALFSAGAYEARHQRTWLGLFSEAVLVAICVGCGWYLSIQFFVLRETCLLCSLAQGFGIGGVALLTLSRRRNPLPDEYRWDGAESPALNRLGLHAALLAASTAAAVGVLAVGPFYGRRESAAPGASQNGEKGSANELLPLHRGQVEIRPADFPLLGRTDAGHFGVVLVDYGCDGCRKLHAILKKRVQQNPDRMAFVMLPAAHDADGERTQRTLLTLFRTDPRKYHSLCAEIVSGAHPAGGELLEVSAAAMAGADVFRNAAILHAEWVETQVQFIRSLRSANKTVSQSDDLPQCLIGNAVLAAAPAGDAAAVDAFISTSLKALSSGR